MITLALWQAIPPLPPTPEPTITVPGPEMFSPWVTLPPAVTLLIALGFFAGTAFVLYPLMRAIGRRIEGRSTATDPAMLAELEQLRHRVADLEAMQPRMAELEERVDFSERLLSQQREAARIAPGNERR